jgi:hypothetical protein
MTRIKAIKQMKGALNKDALLVDNEQIQYWDIDIDLTNFTDEEIENFYDHEIGDENNEK